MRITSETTANGVSEQLFTLGDVTGVLWTPVAQPTSGGAEPRGLVLISHGGGQHKKAPGVAGRAGLYTAAGFAVAAIDAPGHGDRPATGEDERSNAELRAKMTSGEPIADHLAVHHAALAERAVPEWQALLDALPEFGPVGFAGHSMGAGIGIPLVAAEPRITAAAIGLVGAAGLVETAARITVPVEFTMQWDDEFVPRAGALALFEAFGSAEKTLHANPGRHAALPRFEAASSASFFARHLG